MTDPDFRALCSELIDSIETITRQGDHGTCAKIAAAARVERARALLAQPAPEPPTDEELQATYLDALNGSLMAGTAAAIKGLRAVLARWGQGNG